MSVVDWNLVLSVVVTVLVVAYGMWLKPIVSQQRQQLHSTHI